jgi:CBS domain-containing protein
MTVRDIMNKDVVTVAPETDVRDLVQLLARHRISGLPVVDRSGDLAGVVSATDVVALAAYGGEAARRPGSWDNEEGALDEESSAFWRSTDAPLEFVMASATNVPEYQVSDIMTPAVFSVPSTATLPELARFLLHGHIHRALVVDDGALVGIVSAFDVLNAVAQMAELEQGAAL